MNLIFFGVDLSFLGGRRCIAVFSFNVEGSTSKHGIKIASNMGDLSTGTALVMKPSSGRNAKTRDWREGIFRVQDVTEPGSMFLIVESLFALRTGQGGIVHVHTLGLDN